MPELDTTGTAGPYEAAASLYWAAGWRGILPLPERKKKHPPRGYTGGSPLFPSYADIQAWIDGGHARGNIALRLPDGILGVDVDHYDGKRGGDTIANLEQKLGPLPDTWRTTSRDDGTSGIRLYRVPDGLRWPGVVGAAVETVRLAHRYAVVWPSVHPTTGATYRWVNPDGVVTLSQIPTIEDLPELPDAWVMHLSGGETASDQPRANITDAAAQSWVTAHGHGPLCRKMQEVTRDGLLTLNGSTSRHDAAMVLTNRVTWLVGAGHSGGGIALDIIRQAFRAAASDRDDAEFDGEWDRLITGAVRRAAVKYPDGTGDDPCVRPFPADVEAYVASLTTDEARDPRPLPQQADTTAADDDVETSIKRNQYAAQELERLRAQRAAARMLESEDEDQAVADRVRRRILEDKAQAEYRRITEPPAPPFDLGTLADILARPPEPPMRVSGLVPWSGSALVVAQRKTGKTTLLLNYARSMLTGEPFLGCHDVIPVDDDAKVAFLNYEVSGSQLARWADEAGVPADRLVLVNLRGRRNPLGHDDDRAALAAALRDASVQSVIVDPFGRAYTGVSQNDNGEVQSFLVGLEEFVRADVGALDLLLAAHAGWDGERTRGASALEDWGDTIITLTKDDEDRRYLRAIGRDVDLDEDQLVMDELTRVLSLTGMGGRKPTPESAMRRISDLARLVVAAVTADPGCSKTAIREWVNGQPSGPRIAKGGRGEETLTSAIKEAERQGRIIVVRGTNGTASKHLLAEVIHNHSHHSQTTPGSGAKTTTPPPYMRGEGGGGSGQRSGKQTPIAGGQYVYDHDSGLTLDQRTQEIVDDGQGQ